MQTSLTLFEDPLELPRGQAFAEIDLGNVELLLGDPYAACRRFERALDILGDSEDRTVQCAATYGIARAQWDVARNERSTDARRELLERAETAIETALSGWRAMRQNREMVTALMLQAACAQARAADTGMNGDFERAGQLLMEARTFAENTTDRYTVAAIDGRRAMLELARGAEKERVLELCQLSLPVFRELGRPLDVAKLLVVVAEASVGLRNHALARASIEECERLIDDAWLQTLSPASRAGYRSNYAKLARIGQDLVLQSMEEMDDATRAAQIAEGFRRASRWKGRSLLEGVVESKLDGRHPDVRKVRLEDLRLLGLEPEREESSLGAASRRNLDRLRELSPEDAELFAPTGADPDTLRKLLAEEAALVEFTESEDRLLAYVLTRDDLQLVDLGARDDVVRVAEEFRLRCATKSPVTAYWPIAKQMFDLTLGPVLARTDDVTRMVLVPCPSLAAVPFHALPLGPAEMPSSFHDVEFLLDRLDVAYAPSSSALALLAARNERTTHPRAVLFAAPTADSSPNHASTTRAPKPPRSLPGRPQGVPSSTLAFCVPEVERIARELLRLEHWTESERSRVRDQLDEIVDRGDGQLSAAGQLELRLGSAASREALLATDLRDASWLHFACHAVAGLSPAQSGLHLSANEHGNGFVSLADVLGLRLDAELVTLSACSTADGPTVQGEGVQSLAWAFLYAGARSVVATLWVAEDEVAYLVMTRLARELARESSPPSQALRAAVLEVKDRDRRRGPEVRAAGSGGLEQTMQESACPYYWAPYLFIGCR